MNTMSNYISSKSNELLIFNHIKSLKMKAEDFSEYGDWDNDSNAPKKETPKKSEEIVPVVDTNEWLSLLVWTSIPLLNIILLIYWANKQGTNPNKQNYCKAMLIFLGIILIFYLVIIAWGA